MMFQMIEQVIEFRRIVVQMVQFTVIASEEGQLPPIGRYHTPQRKFRVVNEFAGFTL